MHFKKIIVYMLLLAFTRANAEVPVPSASFSTDDGGQTTIHVNGVAGNQHMQVVQPDKFNTYNWDSFNIGRGDSVEFLQPGSSATALNYIHQNSAAQIFGQLNANGNIYLINQNGFLFGEGAKINVGSLVASVLNIDEEMLEENGLLKSMNQKSPAFFADGALVDKDGNPFSIEIQSGAQIVTDGGRVLLVAPEIINGGSIQAPDGQAILAAAEEEVYLAASTDPDLRGIFVEVNGGGSVHNTGEIIAERGNISILGMAINQAGTLRASSSVDVNGSIRLLARDSVQHKLEGASDNKKYFWGSAGVDGALDLEYERNSFQYAVPTRTGKVVFSEDSITEVIPDAASKAKLATNSQNQAASSIDVMGNEIDIESGAFIRATGGNIQIAATTKPDMRKGEEFGADAYDEDTRLSIADGAILDVSGSNDSVIDMSRNQLEVKLLGNELRDSPLQRESVLKGEKIYVDIRESEEIAIADISGEVGRIERGIDERLANGGEIDLISTGDTLIENGSVLDVSGGSVFYKSGFIFESKLLSNGELIPISKADPLRQYQAVLNQGERLNASWNVIEKFDDFTAEGESVFVPAYRQGMDAGSVNIIANPLGNKQPFLFDGNVIANAFIGPYQRAGKSMPDGGKLAMNFQLASNQFANVMIVSEEQFRDRLKKQLSGALTVEREERAIYIPDTLVKNSIDSISIKSSASLEITNDSLLQFDGGGSAQFNAAKTITHAGKIINPGGSVLFRAKAAAGDTAAVNTNIEVLQGAEINTSGLWVNDPWVNDHSTYAVDVSQRPVLIHGGNILLDAGGSVFIDEASLISDGGAHLNTQGGLLAGKGGDISLAAGNFSKNPEANIQLNEKAILRSMSLEDGGALSLTARGFFIGNSPSSADSEKVNLTPAFFQKGGFKRFLLNAKQGGVELGSPSLEDNQHTIVNLETGNYQLSSLLANNDGLISELSTIESGLRLADFAETTVLPRGLGKSVDLIVKSSDIKEQDQNSSVFINRGFTLNTLANSEIAFDSDDSIYVKGSIIAPASDVSFRINRSDKAYDDTQAIRFFNTALIDVSAHQEKLPANDMGFNQYQLFDAGRISLIANRGYILGQGGGDAPVLRADGRVVEQVDFDLYKKTGDMNQASEPLALAAGEIYLRAAEGYIFDAGITANKAGLTGARGGALELVLNANPRLSESISDIPQPVINSFSAQNNSPTILVQDEHHAGNRLDPLFDNKVISQTLSDMPDLNSGVAYVDVNAIAEGGFDEVRLRAINNVGIEVGSTTEHVAAISFATDTPLQVSQALTLDAPSILVADNQATVISNYLQLGTTTMSPEYIQGYGASQIDANAGTLSLQAQFVDLIGAIEFSDAKEVSIYSDNDIRLIGRTNETILENGLASRPSERILPAGQLVGYGNLNLTASQISPGTATTYNIHLPAAGSVLKTFSSGKRSPVLSAQGAVNIEAKHIEHNGVITAPFGQIQINNADTIALNAGSVLSVSGAGAVVPYGEVTDDGVWHYTLAEGKAPFLINENTIKDKSILLQAERLSYKTGSVVDISGGGEILAYKWTKGRGGSQDVLSNDYPGGSFAVLPEFGAEGMGQYGVYDPLMEGGRLPAPGRTISLEGVEGLADGSYAVLPARYAMLPGAYLITPAGNPGDIAEGGAMLRSDGAEIISGKFGFAGHSAQDGQYTPLVVESGAVAYQRSQYDTYLASHFFDTADNVGRLGLTQDAGNLSLVAGSALILEGEMRSKPGENGVGAKLDISADAIEVVNKLDKNSATIQLLANEINELNAESILLGADRSLTADGMRLNVAAESVKIRDGAQLEVPEIMLAARKQVIVSENATIKSKVGKPGAGGIAIIVGDGAFMQVSDGGSWNVIRESSSATSGELILDATTSVFGRGAVSLEAAHSLVLDGDFGSDKYLAFTAKAIEVGVDTPSGDGVLTFSRQQLQSLTAESLRFKSRESLAFSDNVLLQAENVILDTPMLSALDSGTDSTVLARQTLILTNTIAEPHAVVDVSGDAANSSSLKLVSSRVLLVEGEAGAMQVGGFDSVELGEISASAQSEQPASTIRSHGDFKLSVDGTLKMAADWLAAGDGSVLAIEASDSLELVTNKPSSIKQFDAAQGLGSQVRLSAENILLDSAVLASSGNVQAYAEQNVMLGDNAFIDVSGIKRVFGKFEQKEYYSDAGAVRLAAENGSITTAASSVINLSTQSEAAGAGSLVVEAPKGAYDLQGQILVDQFSNGSGQLRLQSQTLSVDSNIFTQLEQWSFNARFDMALGQGDIVLSNEDTLKASEISLRADNGSILVSGKLDASGEQGGEIRLASNETITLESGAVLKANALSQYGDGGYVEFQTQNAIGEAAGGIEIAQNTAAGTNESLFVEPTIDVSSGEYGSGGELRFIVPLTSDATDLKITGGVLNVVGATKVRISPHLKRNDASISQADISDVVAGLDSLSANEGVVTDRVNTIIKHDGNISFEPVVEFYSKSDLKLEEKIDLSKTHWGSDESPGELWLRSESNLLLEHDLHAGVRNLIPQTFFAPYIAQTSPDNKASWGLALVSGADLNAADRRKLVNNPTELSVAENTSIITGTGNIDIRSSGDFTMKEGASIKTIGSTDFVEPAPNTFYGWTENFELAAYPDSGALTYSDIVELYSVSGLSELNAVFFAENGGDISVQVERNITGNGIDQLQSNWRYRANDEFEFGVISGATPEFKPVVGWGVDYDRFKQGIGTLAGGNIHIDAGENIENLLLAAPTVSKPVHNYQDGIVSGGGNITVNAGKDINTMSLLISRGELTMKAGGKIASSAGSDLATLFSYGTAALDLQAAGDIELSGSFSEFMSPVSDLHHRRMDGRQSYWIDESAENTLSMQSLTGDIYFNMDGAGAVKSLFNDVAPESLEVWELYSLLPQRVQAVAMTSDIILEQNTYISPAYNSNLQLLANRNLFGGSDRSAQEQVITSLKNIPVSVLPSINLPARDPVSNTVDFASLNTMTSIYDRDEIREFPEISVEKSTIITNQGDIISRRDWVLDIERPIFIEAGRDIITPQFLLMHSGSQMVSRVIAARDITVPTTRDLESGKLPTSNFDGIYLEGAGDLFVQAGRDIKLGSSGGIRTLGDSRNGRLADEGANLYVLAGISSKPEFHRYGLSYLLNNREISVEQLQAMGFENLDTDLHALPDYLVDVVAEEEINTEGKIALINLDIDQQQLAVAKLLEQEYVARGSSDIFLYDRFFEDLRSAGTKATSLFDKEGFTAYDKSYALIDLIFPGSTAGNGNWNGDISLVFSTLQSEDGGDVKILTPGGGVDVGLTSNLITKPAADLGIFTKSVGSIWAFSEKSIEVNLSRIFSLNGGDILLWSSNGDVDAGKGARSAQSLPPPIVVVDPDDGSIKTVFSAAIDGSGIGGFSQPGSEAGEIFLFAPRGVVDAGEAGIRAEGNLVVGGELLNAENVEVGGVSVGVPSDSGVSASTADLGSVASSSTDSATDAAGETGGDSGQRQTAFLTIDILDVGGFNNSELAPVTEESEVISEDESVNEGEDE